MSNYLCFSLFYELWDRSDLLSNECFNQQWAISMFIFLHVFMYFELRTSISNILYAWSCHWMVPSLEGIGNLLAMEVISLYLWASASIKVGGGIRMWDESIWVLFLSPMGIGNPWGKKKLGTFLTGQREIIVMHTNLIWSIVFRWILRMVVRKEFSYYGYWKKICLESG